MTENEPLKILILAAEVVPFAKTGGLAEVAGALPKAMPLMILLTDGAGNVALTERPPQEKAHKIADLARALGGPCYCLAEPKASELYRTVREKLEGQSGN